MHFNVSKYFITQSVCQRISVVEIAEIRTGNFAVQRQYFPNCYYIPILFVETVGIKPTTETLQVSLALLVHGPPNCGVGRIRTYLAEAPVLQTGTDRHLCSNTILFKNF